MKICFLSCLYGDLESGGGVRSYIRVMSRALAELGHQVTVVTAGRRNRSQDAGGVTVVGMGEVKLLSEHVRFPGVSFLLERLRYMWEAACYILKNDFDLLEVSDGGFEHFFVNFRRRCPIVVRMHASVTDHKRLKIKFPFEFAERIALKTADRLSAATPSSAEYLARKNRIDRRSITVIPNGIEMDRPFHFIDVRRQYGLGRNKVVLSVGMLAYRKGMDTLLWLAGQNLFRKDVTFVAVGAPLEKRNGMTIPENVLCLGFRPADELNSFYSQCDLFFSPSRYETFGLNIAEAMSFGKPVLASNIAGIKDVVKHGENGYLFAVDDRQDLLKQFNKLIDDDCLLTVFGKASRKMAEQYEISSVVKQMEEFYRTTVKNPKSNGAMLAVPIPARRFKTQDA